jgi:hypothetical protein
MTVKNHSHQDKTNVLLSFTCRCTAVAGQRMTVKRSRGFSRAVAVSLAEGRGYDMYVYTPSDTHDYKTDSPLSPATYFTTNLFIPFHSATLTFHACFTPYPFSPTAAAVHCCLFIDFLLLFSNICYNFVG